MLVNMKEMLQAAKAGRYAIPACNVDNEHNLRAAIAAAEEKKAPLILNVIPNANPDLEYFGRIAIDLCLRSPALLCLNLDHGKTYEDCVCGLRAGFTNIMIDRSWLPYEDNVREVKEIVKMAHSQGVTVEAELGHVGVGENYSHDGSQALTDPDEAAQFVNDTDVDALAVAIGTAHGVYKGTPRIHFDLLHELSGKLTIPLVLHGGSGTGTENLARCAREGISKINLSNDLKRAAIDRLLQEDLSGNAVYQLYPLLAEGFKEKIKFYIDLFGCADR